MCGLRTAIILVASVVATGCQRWVRPFPGVRIEPTRAVRHEKDFGPDSAYQLLVQAGKLPAKDETTAGWAPLIDRFREFPWPAQAPQADAPDQPWHPQDYARIRAILAATEPNLALARRAADAPDPQVPTVTSADTLIPYVRPARDVARLMVISSHTKEDTPAEAFADLLVCIRFGNILSRGGSFIGHVVDMATTGMAAEALWCIPTRVNVPSPVLRSAAQELLRIADGVEPFAEAVRGDAQVGLAALDTPNWHGFGVWLGARVVGLLTGSTRRAIKRDLTYFFQHMVNLAAEPYHKDINEQTQALIAAVRPSPIGGVWGIRDPAGRRLAGQMIRILGRHIRMAAERDAVLRGTALYLAILAYEKDTGAPPAALADLVPAYLPHLPLDPFSGRPFRYAVGKSTCYAWGDVPWGVYSIGSDLWDNGGEASRAVSTKQRKTKYGASPDIVWIPKPFPKIPPPKPKAVGIFDGAL